MEESVARGSVWVQDNHSSYWCLPGFQDQESQGRDMVCVYVYICTYM